MSERRRHGYKPEGEGAAGLPDPPRGGTGESRSSMGMAHVSRPWKPCEECGTMINVRARWRWGDARYLCDDHAPAHEPSVEQVIEEMGHVAIVVTRNGVNAHSYSVPKGVVGAESVEEATTALYRAWRERNGD